MKLSDSLARSARVVAVATFIATCGTQAASAQSSVLRTHRLQAGAPVKVTLLGPIDSGQARVGDQVRAQVADDDKSGLPEGTVLVGRVAAVNAATAKTPGSIRINFGEEEGANGGSQAIHASVRLAGRTASSDKSKDTSIGAGAGALLGFSRKRKFGDAIAGGLLGAIGGYAVNQAQKHNAGDVSQSKGSEVTAHLNAPLVLRTEVVAPY